MHLKRRNKGYICNYMKPENGNNKIVINHLLFNILSTRTQKICACVCVCVCVSMCVHTHYFPSTRKMAKYLLWIGSEN